MNRGQDARLPWPFVWLQYRSRARQLRARFPGAQLSVYSHIPPGRVSIGRGTYGSPDIRLFHPDDTVVIGQFCSIGPEVLILAGGGHHVEGVSTYPFRKRADPGARSEAVSKGPVSIGNDVWLGARSTILSGVSIGDGAVIAAGSVVVRDILPYAIVAGNPARVIRNRFEEETAKALLRIRWWDWSDETIRERRDCLYWPVERFVAAFSTTGDRGPGGEFTFPEGYTQ